MLPSQTARPAGSRAHMYRRRRGKRIPVIIALVVVIGGGIVGLKLWPGASNLTPADASSTTGPNPALATTLLQDEQKKTTAPSVAPITKTPPANPASDQPRVNMGPTNPPPATPETAAQLPAQQPTSGAPAATPKDTAEASTESKPQAAPTGDQSQAQAKNNTTPPNTPPGAGASPGAGAGTNQGLNRPAEPAASLTAGNSPSPSSTGTAAQRMGAGMDLLARNKAIDARKMLTEALLTSSESASGGGSLSKADADRIRTALGELNEKLVFGTEVAPNDPYARLYTIESGDVMAKLPRKLSLNVDWRFLQRINRLQDPTRIQVGQKIKVVTGPFHAVVNKNDFRLDLYMGSGDSRVFVHSFAVGLGEFDGTPEGVFMVRPNSKLINPEWVNPRTGERYYADDPNNPIGERWIGLVGVSDNIRDLSGYGIHGTIDPGSIGQMKSMGCVRMNEEDVGLIYEVLMENISRVEIHGDDYP